MGEPLTKEEREDLWRRSRGIENALLRSIEVQRLLLDLERAEADLQQATSLLAQDERMREDFIARLDHLASDLQIEQQQHARTKAELGQSDREIEVQRQLMARSVPEIFTGEIRNRDAEIARLRDIISPGDAAAYEQGMAALQAKLTRAVEALEEARGRMIQGDPEALDVGVMEINEALTAAKGDR